MRHAALLVTVGARVRALRQAQGLSRRQLSEVSGVSERFLAQLEAGEGNISLARLADVAGALATTPGEILSGAMAADRRAVALLGVRGAGKSTVGQALASHRDLRFVEVDREIELAAGLGLGEIFELHGETYYRRLEREVLAHILSGGEAMVLATGGSIVTHRENFALLRERTRTIWLRARAEDHWNRVIKQGDERPMAQNPHAFSELEALLAAREPLYAAADHVIDTSGRTPAEVLDLVAAALGEPLPA